MTQMMLFKKPENLLLSVLSFLTILNVAESSELPNFVFVGSTTENATLSADCKATSKTAIKCKFKQYYFQVPDEKDRQLAVEKLAKITEKANEPEVLRFIESFKQGCKKNNGNAFQNKLNLPEGSLRLAYEKKASQPYESLCNCKKPGIACAVDFENAFSVLKSKTCKVMVQDFEMDFNKLNDKDWVSVASSSFMGCKFNLISTLEKVGDSQFAWAYVQRRENRSTEEICKVTNVNTRFEGYGPGFEFSKCENMEFAP